MSKMIKIEEDFYVRASDLSGVRMFRKPVKDNDPENTNGIKSEYILELQLAGMVQYAAFSLEETARQKFEEIISAIND